MTLGAILISGSVVVVGSLTELMALSSELREA
jgi:hypothetical protein